MNKLSYVILILVIVSTGCKTQQIATTSQTAHKQQVEIPFTISSTGHMLIKAQINDIDVTLIVDTAAGASVLHTKHLKKLGISSTGKLDGVSGLGTSSHTQQIISVPSITIKDNQYNNPFFIGLDLSHVQIAAPDGLLHGLIGSPFLRKYQAVIDYSQNKIYLNEDKR